MLFNGNIYECVCVCEVVLFMGNNSKTRLKNRCNIVISLKFGYCNLNTFRNISETCNNSTIDD